jgi:hypothetical protein
MAHRALVLILSLALLAGAGSALADVSTSPAGVPDVTPSALPQKVLQEGREFRGNPLPLGVLTGAVLLVALGLGVYTLVLVYRPERRRDYSSPRVE